MLAVLLLFVNSGITLFAHTCLRSQQTTIQFSPNDSCCRNVKKTNDDCCEHTADEYEIHAAHENCCVVKIIYVDSDQEQVLPVQNHNFLPALDSFYSIFYRLPEIVTPYFTGGNFRSPPIPTDFLLPFICIWRN